MTRFHLHENLENLILLCVNLWYNVVIFIFGVILYSYQWPINFIFTFIFQFYI